MTADTGGHEPTDADADADADAAGVSSRRDVESSHDDVELIEAMVIEAEAEAEAEADDVDEDAVVAEIVEVVADDPPVAEADLETAIAQRDEYLEALQRVKAEFDNFRKRTESQRVQTVSRAAAGLVAQLLPVLDACDAAVGQGATNVEPIAKVLTECLEKQGLERIGTTDESFDPSLHEAVIRDDGAGEGADDELVVVEVLRAGYRWKGDVLRTAMVKVRG